MSKRAQRNHLDFAAELPSAQPTDSEQRLPLKERVEKHSDALHRQRKHVRQMLHEVQRGGDLGPSDDMLWAAEA